MSEAEAERATSTDDEDEAFNKAAEDRVKGMKDYFSAESCTGSLDVLEINTQVKQGRSSGATSKSGVHTHKKYRKQQQPSSVQLQLDQMTQRISNLEILCRDMYKVLLELKQILPKTTTSGPSQHFTCNTGSIIKRP